MKKRRLLALLLAGALMMQSGAALAAEIDISDSEDVTEEIVIDDGVDEVFQPVEDVQEEQAEESVQSITVEDGSIVDSGTCGVNLTWTLDSEGTLTISGKGDMRAFYQSPWSGDSVYAVKIQAGVTSIGDRAFQDCDDLVSVTIPSSVTTIGSHAFMGCDGLKNVTIPDSVTDVGDWAFWGCSHLTSVTIGNGVQYFGNDVFAYCDGLRSVKFGNRMTSISEGMFTYCDSLTNVVIPETVTRIGDTAFMGCDSITSMTIPNNVTSIGDNAFDGCDQLTSVTIGIGLTRLGEFAFYGCDRLTDIYYKGSQSQWNSIFISDYNSNLENIRIHYNWGTATHSHTWSTEKIVKATPFKNGSIQKKCSGCGKITSETIYLPRKVYLSHSEFVYNGITKRPSVTVKDSAGQTISSSNYTLSYESGRKYVGTYAATVTFKGSKYNGIMSRFFVINPKATALSSVTATSKGFTARWSKVTTQTTGYQLQYSTSRKFTNAKKVTITSNKTTSKKITKLSAKKKYYVRVRTYKTVSGKKYYSSWSSAKAVTTKK